MSDAAMTGPAVYLSGTVDEVTPGGGYEGKGSAYVIVAEDGQVYGCDYTDLVTDGFRTLRAGQTVRFSPGRDVFGLRARNVLKLDEPTVEDLYGRWMENEAPLRGPR